MIDDSRPGFFNEIAGMTEIVSKRKSAKSRAPAVTFVATPTGLSIRIAMSRERATAIVGKAGSKARAKAKASQAVLSALRDLKDEDPRDRSCFLQADIPSQLKAELAKVAKAKGTDITALVFDVLSEWIDPDTGERRRIKGKGLLSRAGPKSYRDYTRSTDAIYSEALRGRSLVRLQVEVGHRVVQTIDRLLYRSRVSKGRFLTALAASVRNRNQVSVSGPTEAAEKSA